MLEHGLHWLGEQVVNHLLMSNVVLVKTATAAAPFDTRAESEGAET